MMTRRGLLASLAGALAAAAVDPEKLLWTPGAKLISVPAASVQPDFLELGIYYYLPGFMDLSAPNALNATPEAAGLRRYAADHLRRCVANAVSNSGRRSIRLYELPIPPRVSYVESGPNYGLPHVRICGEHDYINDRTIIRHDVKVAI